jgi:uncharacterized protein YndB with AHSA1/START domain
MATNEIHIDAPPDEVFALWADGCRYADWVVGAKEIRDVDPGWPKVGAKIHHTVGFGPITLDDNTEVVGLDEPKRLELDARVRPFGRARIELTVEADGTGSLVTMQEWVTGVPHLIKKGADVPIAARNVETLRRLKDIIEAR